MTKRILSKLLLVVFIISFSSELTAQKKRKKSKKNDKQTSTVKPPQKPKPKKGAIQPYGKVVTKDMKTDDGLFKVHSKDNSYLFEIPDTLMNREMLMVTRIAKTASGIGFGGGKTNTQVLRWERKNKNILLRIVSHQVVADTILPVHEAVVNSNFEPVLYSFPIKAYNKDTTGVVVDASKFLTDDIKPMGFPQSYRTRYLSLIHI